jgi:hypothetical protein
LDEDGLASALGSYTKFLSENLDIKPPYAWTAGISNLNDHRLVGLSGRGSGAGPAANLSVQVSGVLANADADFASALEPFFAVVFDNFGLTRP